MSSADSRKKAHKMVEVNEIDKLIEIGNKLRQLSDQINQYDIPRTNFSTILENEELLAVYYKDWALIRELIKLEIEELNRCEEDVNRWPNYRLTNRIDFFSERVVLYLRGGRSKFDGAQFLGLYTHFRDSELKDAILKSAIAKKLLFYRREREFFSKAGYAISRSIREGGWEEFYDFYRNLKRGKNYVRMVRETFGNEEFADFLENLPREVHENPTAWEEGLKELSYRLEDVSYQNRYVIHPAVQTLLTLFRKAKERLFKGEDIEKRKEKLRKDIEKLKREFDKIDNPVVDEMSKVMPTLIDLMTKVGITPERRLGALSKTLDVYGSWLERYKAIAQRLFSKPVVPVGVAFFAAVQSDNLAVTKNQVINMPLFNQTFEPYTDQLKNHINTILIPKFHRVIDFISKQNAKFTIPISDTRELLPEVQELLLRHQGQLIDEFKKEGIYLTKPLYG